MPDVRLTRDEAQGKLPAVCMCCGEPATAWVEHTFMLEDPVVSGPSVFLEVKAVRLLLAAANTPRLTLPTSFCPAHRHYWGLRWALVFGGLAGLFAVLFVGAAMVIVLFAVAKVEEPWPVCFLLGPLLLYLTAWLIALKLVQGGSIRVRLTEGGAVALQNVGERYISALKAGRQRPG